MRFITCLLIALLGERENTYCPYCGTDPCSNLTENCAG